MPMRVLSGRRGSARRFAVPQPCTRVTPGWRPRREGHRVSLCPDTPCMGRRFAVRMPSLLRRVTVWGPVVAHSLSSLALLRIHFSLLRDDSSQPFGLDEPSVYASPGRALGQGCPRCADHLGNFFGPRLSSGVRTSFCFSYSVTSRRTVSRRIVQGRRPSAFPQGLAA